MDSLAICTNGDQSVPFFKPFGVDHRYGQVQDRPYGPIWFSARRVHYRSGIGVPLLAALLAFVVVAIRQMSSFDIRIGTAAFAGSRA